MHDSDPLALDAPYANGMSAPPRSFVSRYPSANRPYTLRTSSHRCTNSARSGSPAGTRSSNSAHEYDEKNALCALYSGRRRAAAAAADSDSDSCAPPHVDGTRNLYAPHPFPPDQLARPPHRVSPDNRPTEGAWVGWGGGDTHTSSRMRMSCGIENASRVSSYVNR